MLLAGIVALSLTACGNTGSNGQAPASAASGTAASAAKSAADAARPSSYEALLLSRKVTYANSLVPFLTKHFGEIDVIDLRYYDGALLDLVQERQFQEMLILYNIKTFFEEPSILNITEGMP